MWLTNLHDLYGSSHLCICRSLFGHSTFLPLHSCSGRAFHVVFKEEFQVELSRKLALWHFFSGLVEYAECRT